MDRNNYINGIIHYIRGLSGINYQKAIGIILSVYYKGIKIYEMPSSLGGDDKNDGWVVEDGLFYQIYSPVQFSSSFATSVKDKFAEDLEGLIQLVYIEKKWNGIVNSFIYIVNTRDDNLPKDPTRFYEKTVDDLVKKYNINNTINFEVCNDEYIYDILFDADDIKLEHIATRLNIQGLINLNKTSAQEIIDFIDLVAKAMQEKGLNCDGSDYKRVSTDKKIEINNLLQKKDRILNIIPKLSVVDDAICHFSQSIKGSQIFELVKDEYIKIYNELSSEYNGAELYDQILKRILEFAPTLNAYCIPAEMVLVYIFDRCDIFLKEEMKNDIA